jgi:hypothetical protein
MPRWNFSQIAAVRSTANGSMASGGVLLDCDHATGAWWDCGSGAVFAGVSNRVRLSWIM